ncbi:MAG: hypothetical protein JSW55_00240 [Chloroflexota bacterium]|nr:MAG: hypothetical protein JSW55_00240 [Chloroflexota bacterium]
MSEKSEEGAEKSAEEYEASVGKAQEKGSRRRRKAGRSMFGPILLISIGVFLLLANLDLLPELNWRALLRLWPLALILVGLNVIVRQFGRPVGTFLSAMLALLAVAAFSYVLLFADRAPFIGDRLETSAADVKEERVSFPVADVSEADVFVDFAAPGGQVFDLVDSSELINAKVTYVNELLFESEMTGGQAAISLATVGSSDWAFWSDPFNWFDQAGAEPWQIGLSPRVPTSLELNLGSGTVEMALESLNLRELLVDGGSGSAKLAMPPGDYDVEYDVGSGSVIMTLPAGGAHDVNIDGGSASLTVIVPVDSAVQLTTEGGSGGLNLRDELFEPVGRTDGNEGRWQTAGYEDSSDRTNVYIDIGSGSVTFEAE